MSDNRPLDTILDWVRKIAATPRSIPDNVREAISKLDLTWQEGKPTGEGYYWLSYHDDKSEPFIEDVHYELEGKTNELIMVDSGVIEYIAETTIKWFAGPIPEPTA